MPNQLLQRFFLLGSLLCPAVTAVRADTISNFNFSATFTNGATGTGLVSIDITTGMVTLLNVGITGGGTGYAFTGPEAQGLSDGGYYASDFNVKEQGVVLSFSQSSLVGYAGGQLCSLSMSCLGFYPSTFYATDSIGIISASSAALMPSIPAPAPEIDPSLGYGGALMLAGGIAVLRGQRRASPE